MVDTVMKHLWISHLHFVDYVLFPWAKQHTRKIGELMDTAGPNVTFAANAPANHFDDLMIEHLARSGLERRCFELETVDPTMRETMGKKIPLSACGTANRTYNKYGAKPIISSMLELTGDARLPVEMLIDFSKDNRDDIQESFASAVPNPGTRLYAVAADEQHGLKLTENFLQVSMLREG